MRSKLVSVTAIAGLSLGLAACREIRTGPTGGLKTIEGIPAGGRIINVTRGDGDIHGVWIEAMDGSLVLVWVNSATGDVYGDPQTFARK
jgi:hypothetical protein